MNYQVYLDSKIQIYLRLFFVKKTKAVDLAKNEGIINFDLIQLYFHLTHFNRELLRIFDLLKWSSKFIIYFYFFRISCVKMSDGVATVNVSLDYFDHNVFVKCELSEGEEEVSGLRGEHI